MLSLAAMLPFVHGLKKLAGHGWEWFPAVALVFGIAVGVVFVQREVALPRPASPLRQPRPGW